MKKKLIELMQNIEFYLFCEILLSITIEAALSFVLKDLIWKVVNRMYSLLNQISSNNHNYNDNLPLVRSVFAKNLLISNSQLQSFRAKNEEKFVLQETITKIDKIKSQRHLDSFL